MATIEPYETAAGKRYRVRYRTPERRQTTKRGFTSRREAESFLATVEVSKLKGEYIAPSHGRRTVGELATDWLELKSLSKPSYLATLQGTMNLHVLPRWGRTPIAEVTTSSVQAWVNKLAADRSASVVKRAHGILAGILDMAVKDGKLNAN